MNSAKKQYRGKGCQREQAANMQVSLPSQEGASGSGGRRILTARRTRQQVSAVKTMTVYENAEPKHPDLQIIAVACGDGRTYTDANAPNKEAIAKAMQSEIVALKKEVSSVIIIDN